ncbi:MAG: xanthine dehydrogenase family protein molybdopterin-binding subunit [Fuerstiella sp.]|nr:xanthine dehydrogenase family protein molybdopterin-binding subunit [Fuerstiella sp.]MCP4855977.1 xanthine dehydrogenase family protein molybdopterin-binding subunit [Fuerstiella sp.]
MAEVTYSWPENHKARLIGKRVSRLDGMEKSTGTAKYTYDINLPKQLVVRALGCPHAHCRVISVDTSAAERVPGVVLVHLLKAPQPGDDPVEIRADGTLLVAVAGETEAIAAEGVSKLKVKYELLESFVDDHDLQAAEAKKRTKKAGGGIELDEALGEPGDDDDEEEWEEQKVQELFAKSKYVVEGNYGIDTITHCCLEPHGSTLHWEGDRLKVNLSTQNVSRTDDGYADALKISADEVDVHCEYIGGGFGSKFKPDYWSIAAAEIAKKAGRPIKFLLTRDQELKIGGNRPSGFIDVKLGADENGVVQVWDSHHWGTSGFNGSTVSVGNFPYVFRPKNWRRRATGIITDNEPSVAWRAPNHPQACAITQTAYDDLAAKMQADSLDIFLRNLENIDSPEKSLVYAEQLRIAAELIDWRKHWHLHGKGNRRGSVVEGLGIGIHKWGGSANSSNCLLKIHPDGGVESYCGTQDLGTGTRTICAMVLAETLGLPIEAVKVNIGSSKYPFSGASGGSTTVGAVSESHRRAAQDILAQLFDLVAKKLEVPADKLEASNGSISVVGYSDKSVSWKQACSLIGIQPLEVTSIYKRGDDSPLSSSNVAGCQMARVAVDTDTGVVKIIKMVAVQDMGLVMNRKTAESQVYGAMIMSIAAALFEQRINDPTTGAFINSELDNYRLPRLGDTGELVVHFHEPESERSRGVIGLGEPPAISGGAAIANAVCNATGVRVPTLPLTPKRVLDALRTAKG